MFGPTFGFSRPALKRKDRKPGPNKFGAYHFEFVAPGDATTGDS